MSQSQDRDRIDRICDQFEAAWLSGQHPTIADFIADHPEPFRTALQQELLVSLQALERTVTNQRPTTVFQSTALAIPLRIGEYHIRREIGRGGMGVVYEAMQPTLDRHEALKILPAHRLRDPRLRQRFERGAKAAGRLHHTNIVPVFGVGEADGQPYYVL